ncbi:MAG TPA: DNA-binding protein [Thermoanaerobaculia bacterium]|nr:DNA-binding protein [Thermoanaerobaculia bacterium]
MNRSDLQKLTDLRLEDAKVLLDASRFEAAYYLLGYAVECALKSCIAKQIREFDFPDKKLVNDSYVHDLKKLLNISGIERFHDAEMSRNRAFATNWGIVKDWSENTRYQVTTAESLVRDFFAAVTEPPDGVITWLKKYW